MSPSASISTAVSDIRRPNIQIPTVESRFSSLNRITRSRLAEKLPDVHIAPRLGHIGLFEFDRAGEIILVRADFGPWDGDPRGIPKRTVSGIGSRLGWNPRRRWWENGLFSGVFRIAEYSANTTL